MPRVKAFQEWVYCDFPPPPKHLVLTHTKIQLSNREVTLSAQVYWQLVKVPQSSLHTKT